MLTTGLRLIGAALRLTWLLSIIAVLGLVLLPHAMNALDREMYVVRGASMEPAIPLGAVAVVQHAAADAVRVGDVITFRVASGTIVTHRVVDLDTSGGLAFRTKGDASLAGDALVLPASALVGSVEWVLPGVGIAMTVLGTTMGALTALAFIGGLLMAIVFVDELAVAVRRPRRTVLAEPAR